MKIESSSAASRVESSLDPRHLDRVFMFIVSVAVVASLVLALFA